MIAKQMGVSQSYVRYLASVKKISLRLPLELDGSIIRTNPKKWQDAPCQPASHAVPRHDKDEIKSRITMAEVAGALRGRAESRRARAESPLPVPR